MHEPLEIAIGHLTPGPGDAGRQFRLFLVAEDAVELRFEASGIKRVIPVEHVAGYEVRKAVEKAMGGAVTIDWARSRLTFGGLR